MLSQRYGSVLVFRKYLLSYSETFIADQGRFLTRYQPYYAGLNAELSGKHLLDDMPTFILEKDVSNIALSKFLYRLGILNRQWVEDIESKKPNIIHAHFLNDGVDALQLKKRLAVPLVATLHGHDITKHEKKGFSRSKREKLFHRADRVIAVSDYIYHTAIAKGCPEHKLIKHSIGIDLEKFNASKQETASPELLFVGRLVEKKGCVYLLDAMKLLAKQYPELKLVIVGDGPLKNMLENKVREDQLNVEFVGRESAESIRARLSKAWVFVAPSITAANGDAEGLGMVFLEAQALHTPVVSFSSGGVVEAVENGETGLLSEEKNVSALAENIEFFINSETVRREFGVKGRKRVEDKFDIRKQCVLLEDIYDSVR